MVSLLNSLIDKLKLIFSSKRVGSPNQKIKIKGVNGEVKAQNINIGDFKNAPRKKR